MATAEQSLDTVFAEIRDAGTRSRRKSRRRHAESYRRRATTLLSWTFPASRTAVTGAIAAPDSPAATRILCRALWRDLQAARALPRYLAGRPLRIAALRILFACECACYRRQRAADKRAAAQALTTGEWLTGICRKVEAGWSVGAARKTIPRPVPRPRRPERLGTADRPAPTTPRRSAKLYPEPGSGPRQ